MSKPKGTLTTSSHKSSLLISHNATFCHLPGFDFCDIMASSPAHRGNSLDQIKLLKACFCDRKSSLNSCKLCCSAALGCE